MSKIVERTESGKLKINTLNLEILIEGMFELCKNEHEVEFVNEAITGTVENKYEEMLSELN